MSGTDRRPVLTTLLTVLGCLAMLWVEWVLSPVYPVKSSAKALVFLGCAAAYVLASGDRQALAEKLAVSAARKRQMDLPGPDLLE